MANEFLHWQCQALPLACGRMDYTLVSGLLLLKPPFFYLRECLFLLVEYSSDCTFISLFPLLKDPLLRKCLRHSRTQRLSCQYNDMFPLFN